MLLLHLRDLMADVVDTELVLLFLLTTEMAADGALKEVSKGLSSALGVPVLRNFRLASKGL